MDENRHSPADDAADEYVEPTYFRRDHAPAVLLLVPMAIAFLMMGFGDGGMIAWAVSRTGLGNGDLAPLQLHMFAHGSVLHLLMNGSAFYGLGAAVVHRLGSGPRAVLLFLVLFELAGLGGAAAFVLIHPWPDAPMLGASGAIIGLAGFLIRYPRPGATIVPLWSRPMGRAMIAELKEHVWLFLYFGLLPLLTATADARVRRTGMGGAPGRARRGAAALPPAAARGLAARAQGDHRRGAGNGLSAFPPESGKGLDVRFGIADCDGQATTSGDEVWTVGGRTFGYGAGSIRIGYSRVEALGGAVHADSRVRVHFINNEVQRRAEILRLDVQDAACPAAPDPQPD